MKLTPKRDQLVGRLLITKLASAIVAPDPTKNVTKMLLVQAVGEDAAAAGYEPGDIVVPTSLGNMHLRGGTLLVTFCAVKDVLFKVEDVNPIDVTAEDGRTEIESLDPAHPCHSGTSVKVGAPKVGAASAGAAA